MTRGDTYTIEYLTGRWHVVLRNADGKFISAKAYGSYVSAFNALPAY